MVPKVHLISVFIPSNRRQTSILHRIDPGIVTVYIFVNEFTVEMTVSLSDMADGKRSNGKATVQHL